MYLLSYGSKKPNLNLIMRVSVCFIGNHKIAQFARRPKLNVMKFFVHTNKLYIIILT